MSVVGLSREPAKEGAAMTDQDEAARQAAELLPCPRANDFPRLGDCGFCHVCVLRPAVAAKLREHQRAVLWANDQLSACEMEVKLQRERIAALEAGNERLRAELSIVREELKVTGQFLDGAVAEAAALAGRK